MNHYVATITDDGYAVVDQFKKPVSLGRTLTSAIERFLADYPETRYVGVLDTDAWKPHHMVLFASVISEDYLFELLGRDYVYDGVIRHRGYNVVTIRPAAGDEQLYLACQPATITEMEGK